ncbi:MAG: flagellar hook-basal body complex protein [Fibrobacterales bacterium]
MLRSLYSGISGLHTHQVQLDVIGNNIANVNTVGYKSTRVTFEESFAQLLEGSSRPPGNGGGTNPMQVGLGTSVGSIDTKLSQGNMLSTGQITDLAIEGKGYFAVSNGEGNFFTRNGSFQLDSDGKMVLPTNGYVLQGVMANEVGEFPSGSVEGNITIPFNEQAPAKETDTVKYSRNLNSDSGAKGSVVYTNRFLQFAQPSTAGGFADPAGTGALVPPKVSSDWLTALYDSKGRDLGIEPGDVLTYEAVDAAGLPLTPLEITIVDPSTTAGAIITGTNATAGTVDEMLTAINNWFNGQGYPGTQAGIDDGPGSVNRGSVTVDNTAGVQALVGFQVSSDRPISDSMIRKAFNFPATIAVGNTGLSDSFRYPAEATDLMSQLYDTHGDALGLETGDTISVNGTVGGESSTPSMLNYSAATTTIQNLMDSIKDGLKLPFTDGTVAENQTVTINGADSNDQINDGTIVIRGVKGADFALENINVTANNSNNQNPTPKLFNANMASEEFQAARDTGVFDTSISVYDESGAEHVLTTTFTHTGVPGEWLWKVTASGDERILGGDSGTLSFAQDGSVGAFIFTDSSSGLIMDPNNGSNQMTVNLDMGGPGDFQGLTQFEAQTSASAVGQNGYGTGSLTDISIDEYGMVSGSFTNGTSRALARVMVTEFTNPGGLLKLSDSVFTVSSNSGDPISGIPGLQSKSKLRPGALEGSNVDLAAEFTSMITTQRGFQANSRIITVSDKMMEELIQLKR